MVSHIEDQPEIFGSKTDLDQDNEVESDSRISSTISDCKSKADFEVDKADYEDYEAEEGRDPTFIETLKEFVDDLGNEAKNSVVMKFHIGMILRPFCYRFSLMNSIYQK